MKQHYLPTRRRKATVKRNVSPTFRRDAAEMVVVPVLGGDGGGPRVRGVVAEEVGLRDDGAPDGYGLGAPRPIQGSACREVRQDLGLVGVSVASARGQQRGRKTHIYKYISLSGCGYQTEKKKIFECICIVCVRGVGVAGACVCSWPEVGIK